jgi:hypothetical protein
MPRLRATDEVFEEEFLPLRAKLLEVAASLDRVGRADGAIDADPRRAQIGAAIQTLLHHDEDRAERIQMIFSRPYEEDWRQKFRMMNDE